MGKTLQELSAEEVGLWLRRNKLARLEARFKERGVDGATLCQQNWETLRRDLGLTQSGVRQQLLRRVAEARDVKDCRIDAPPPPGGVGGGVGGGGRGRGGEGKDIFISG